MTKPLQHLKDRSKYILIIGTIFIFSLLAINSFSSRIRQIKKVSPIGYTSISKNIPSWKTYRNNFPKYSISYPDNWILQGTNTWRESPDTWHVSDLVITNYYYNDSYQINFDWPSAYSPSYCRYEDDPDFMKEDDGHNCAGEFKQFSGGQGLTFRRLIRPSEHPTKPNTAEWSVLIKEKESKGFASQPVVIGIIAPINYDPAMIEVMDNIIATFVDY